MKSNTNNVNTEIPTMNSGKKSIKEEKEMINLMNEIRKGICCRTMPCLSITDYTNNDHNPSKQTGSAQNARNHMRIWGMISDEDENEGFTLLLDADCYVLMLYYQEKLMALFDPYDYTLPELNEALEKVMQAIRQNPLVICRNRVFWSQN